MFAHNLKRLIPAAACLLFLFIVLFHTLVTPLDEALSSRVQWAQSISTDLSSQTGNHSPNFDQELQKAKELGVGGGHSEKKPSKPSSKVISEPTKALDAGIGSSPTSLPLSGPFAPAPKTHHELVSTSTSNGAYFNIEFSYRSGYNPSIIPHPTHNDTWIIIAQSLDSAGSPKDSVWSTQIVCNAAFQGDLLMCIEAPNTLPIASTPGGEACKDNDLGKSLGPHDARVFMGPWGPWAMWGSLSKFTCFGKFMQDFRMLVDWGSDVSKASVFKYSTELQRPKPYAFFERGWFIFWDAKNEPYVHYEMFPKRMFARITDPDGSVGPNLAPKAADAGDEKCMGRFMPKSPDSKEQVIQEATNSLMVTACNREDPGCVATDDNTFIMTIFQQKSSSATIASEPYVALFKRVALFELYAISSKPLWIRGRSSTSNGRDNGEFINLSSISWAQQGLLYHGFADDMLFIGFGIDDKRTTGIDVMLADLLKDMNFCGDI